MKSCCRDPLRGRLARSNIDRSIDGIDCDSLSPMWSRWKNDSSDSHCSLPLCCFLLGTLYCRYILYCRYVRACALLVVFHSLLCILFILTLSSLSKLVSLARKVCRRKLLRSTFILCCVCCVLLFVLCFLFFIVFHGVCCYCWFPSFRCICWKKHTSWWNTLYLQEEPFALIHTL